MKMKNARMDKAIETVIRHHNGELSGIGVARHVIFRHDVSYDAVRRGISRLKKQNKIIIQNNGNITWIFYPGIYKKLMKQSKEA